MPAEKKEEPESRVSALARIQPPPVFAVQVATNGTRAESARLQARHADPDHKSVKGRASVRKMNGRKAAARSYDDALRLRPGETLVVDRTGRGEIRIVIKKMSDDKEYIR